LLAAGSIEGAVTHAAVLLLAVGAVCALAWGLLYRRMGILRWPLLAITLGTLGAGTALGAWDWYEKRDRTVRGSPTKEFVLQRVQKKRTPQELREEPWPTYGYDQARTRSTPFRMRPPYVGLWKVKTNGSLEPPATVAYGRVFLANSVGTVYAIGGRLGKVHWKRRFHRCIAASAAVSDHVVYQPLMHPIPCQKNASGATGYIVALDPKTGRTLWRFRAGPVESAPLIVGHILYFGSWDHRVYALNLHRKRNRVLWSYETDDKVVASPAYANGTIYVATNGGRVYALRAKPGRLRWRAESSARFGRRE